MPSHDMSGAPSSDNGLGETTGHTAPWCAAERCLSGCRPHPVQGAGGGWHQRNPRAARQRRRGVGRRLMDFDQGPHRVNPGSTHLVRRCGPADRPIDPIASRRPLWRPPGRPKGGQPQVGAGFEPAARVLKARCSTRLSYPCQIPAFVRTHVRYASASRSRLPLWSPERMRVRRWPGGIGCYPIQQPACQPQIKKGIRF